MFGDVLVLFISFVVSVVGVGGSFDGVDLAGDVETTDCRVDCVSMDGVVDSSPTGSQFGPWKPGLHVSHNSPLQFNPLHSQ